MWKEIGMIGRDSILENKILPRIRAKQQFVLSGPPGIGKTALLQWTFDNTKALCGDITIPFFERLKDVEKTNNTNGNSTCGLIWGGKGKGKTNLAHWLVSHRLDTEQVYVIDPKRKGMNTWFQGAQVSGTDYNYAEIEQTLSALLQRMRSNTDRFTVVIDEINILKREVKNFSDMWLPFAQEGRQYGKSVWIIGQSQTADSLGLKGKYDLTRCFDMFVEACWDSKKNKRYLTVAGDKDKDPEKLLQPALFGSSQIPHPNPPDRSLPKKAFTSGALAHGQMVKEIADQWGISSERLTVKDLERIIFKQSGNYCFIDEMLRLQVASITFLKVLKERNHFYGAMRNDRMKEDLKQHLWGFEIIKIGAIDRKSCLILAFKAALHYGCKVSHNQIALASNGNPGRIHSFCETDEIPKEDTRMSSEEINIAPLIIIMGVFLILMRVVGRAIQAMDLTILGMVAMILMIVMRGMFSRMSK